LLPAALLVPFWNKAFHIDDSLFLVYARLVSQNPLNPFAMPIEYDGRMGTVFTQPNPLLWPYALAVLRSIFGEVEWALHLLTFACAVLALHGITLLARRLGVSAVLACLFFSGTSAFVVMGSTIMPDVPAAGLALASLGYLIRGVEDNQRWPQILAGLLAGAAFLMRYSALVVIGLLLFYPLVARRLRWGTLLALGTALALVGASELWATIFSGKPHFVATLAGWAQPAVANRVREFAFLELVYLGAQVPLLGFCLISNWRRAIGLGVGGLALALLLGGPIRDAGRVELLLAFAWPAAALLIEAATLLLSGLARVARRHPSRELNAIRMVLAALMVGGTFVTIRYIHVASKYMLLPSAAVILLVLDSLRRSAAKAQFNRFVFSMSLGLTLCIGFLVGLSDFRWANTYRSFFAQRYPTIASTRGNNYYSGDWGFRYYSERAGLRPWHGETLTQEDRLVFSSLVPSFLAGLGPVQPMSVEELSYPGPFALMDLNRQAGFYSNSWGVYPYVPATTVSDVLTIVRGLAPTASAAQHAPSTK
jgi:hypothetical protein